MENTILYNEFVTTPTLLFEELIFYEHGSGREVSREEATDDIAKLCYSSYHLGKEGYEKFWKDSIEVFCRHMVTSCATKVRFPALGGDDIPHTKIFKRGITESLRKKLVLSDQSASLWSAVLKYIEPISASIHKSSKAFHTLESVAWNVYLLALSSKTKAEVSISPHRVRNSLRFLLNEEILSSEAKARLSNLVGLFSLYSEPDDIPCFRIKPNISSLSVSERIEEIIEDAYLLEASQLRRFLGLRANIASIKRDLRKITKFISKNRKWAKAILTAGSEFGYIPTVKTGEKLLDALSGILESEYSPICIKPSLHLSNLMSHKNDCAVQVSRSLHGSVSYTVIWADSIKLLDS